MFKIFKKLYFKFYHLLRFLGIFILIFGLKNNVYAEEYKSCYDDYKIGNVSFQPQSGYWKYILPVIPVTETYTKYYVRFFPSEPYTGNSGNYFHQSPVAVKSDGTESSYYLGNVSFDVSTQVLSFTTSSLNIPNFVGLKFLIYSLGSNYLVLENSPVIMSTNLDDLLSCVESPPSPGNNVFSDFLTIYIDKITYLSNGFLENPYLLAMVGIIFAWIVLELFLHIFHLKGGYKK